MLWLILEDPVGVLQYFYPLLVIPARALLMNHSATAGSPTHESPVAHERSKRRAVLTSTSLLIYIKTYMIHYLSGTLQDVTI